MIRFESFEGTLGLKLRLGLEIACNKIDVWMLGQVHLEVRIRKKDEFLSIPFYKIIWVKYSINRRKKIYSHNTYWQIKNSKRVKP